MFIFAILGFVLSSKANGGTDKFCKNIVTPEDQEFAHEYIEAFRDGDPKKTEAAIALMNHAYRPDLDRGKSEIQKLALAIKGFEEQTIGCNVSTNGLLGGETTRFVNLSYEWSGPASWYVGNVAWRSTSNIKEVEGFSIRSLTAPLEKIHAFSLTGKGPVHWLFLVSGFLIAAFILVTLVACFRRKGLKRKWLWLVFILMGFFQVSLNWTTGEMIGFIYRNGSGGWNFNALSFLLFGASMARPGEFAPWIVTISLPVGAILFWIVASKRSSISEPNSKE
ncbi:MAG: hypothetical protein ACXVB8_08950 [Bdellovibrionota bacterium]